MGLTHVSGYVSNEDIVSDEILFLVDSGATYSLIPKEIWEKLHMKATREGAVQLADGTLLKRPVSRCLFKILGAEEYSPVLLGESGDEPLLGAVTLENFGFVLDPLKRKIIPMQLRA